MTDDASQQLKENLKSRRTWQRFLYMVVFTVIYGIVELVIAAVVVFQFLHTLVTAQPNRNLVRFGQSLSTYVYQIMLFLLYNSDDQPFPFTEWPDGAPLLEASPQPRKRSKKTRSAKGSAEDT